MFIVMGTTGEYSDRTEWPVAAYKAEASAKAHAEVATAWVREKMEALGWEASWKERDEMAKSNPFDPRMHCDYTGTTYFIYEVPVLTAVPTVTRPMPREQQK